MDMTPRASTRTRYSYADAMVVSDGIVQGDDGLDWCATCKVWQVSEFLECSDGGDSGDICSICGCWTDL